MERAWNNKDWAIESGDSVDIRAGTVVYIAGPMTGMPDYNRSEFLSAEDFFAQEGALVLNPARLPLGMPDSAYMPICLAMLNQADVIAILPGWQESMGSLAEMFFATKQRKEFLYLKHAEQQPNGVKIEKE